MSVAHTGRCLKPRFSRGAGALMPLLFLVGGVRVAAQSGARPGDSALVVMAVGDMMLGTSFPDANTLPPAGGDSVLAPLAPLLRSADVAFGNLEGPLLDGGISTKCTKDPRNCYAFRSPTRYVRHFAEAGFDVLSIANNHAMDFGVEGRTSTMRLLDSAGIRYSGPPGVVARWTAKGRSLSCIAFAFDDDSYNLLDIGAARTAVRRLARTADIVIVSFHGGAEGASAVHVPRGMERAFGERRGNLRAFAHAMVDAGADLVLGHGPHVVRGMEVYRHRLIAYSLGNFATYAMFNLSGPTGISLVLEAHLARDGTFLGGRVHPTMQEKPGGARRDRDARIVPLLRRLSREDFGARAIAIDDSGRIAAP